MFPKDFAYILPLTPLLHIVLIVQTSLLFINWDQATYSLLPPPSNPHLHHVTPCSWFSILIPLSRSYHNIFYTGDFQDIVCSIKLNKWLIGNSLKKRCSSRTVMLVISVVHCKGRTTSQTSWYLTNRRICGQTQESFEHYPVPPPRAQ